MNKELLEQYEQLGFKSKTFSSRWTFNVITERSKINNFVNDQCISNLLNEIQKWLREKRILIDVFPLDAWDNWVYKIIMEDISTPFFELNWNGVEYNTYEEALEAGIKESLKYIGICR